MKKTDCRARGWDANGIRQLEPEAGSVAQVQQILAEQSPSISRQDMAGCVVFISGKPGSKRSKPKDGDRVMFMSPVAGG